MSLNFPLCNFEFCHKEIQIKIVHDVDKIDVKFLMLFVDFNTHQYCSKYVLFIFSISQKCAYFQTLICDAKSMSVM